MANSVTWKLFVMLQVLAFSRITHAMMTQRSKSVSVVSHTFTDGKKQVVRNNPARVSFVVDPRSIIWGRPSSPIGNGVDGIRGVSALGPRYNSEYLESLRLLSHCFYISAVKVVRGAR